MKATWLGEDGGPRAITQFGIKFEAGKESTVPDNHRYVKKFVNNPFFEVTGAPAGLIDPGPDESFVDQEIADLNAKNADDNSKKK